MSKTLLLADDSVTIQKVVGITFASEDVELITVDNGDDALSRARQIKPDLVLADISMPGLDGYELCAAVKADPDLAHIPVILLTGTFETFDERRTSEVGADAHIAKPFEAQALVDLVHSLLERQPSPASEEMAPQPAAERIEDLTPAPRATSRPPAEAVDLPELPTAQVEESEPLDDEFAFDDLDFESEAVAEAPGGGGRTRVLAEIPTLDPDLLPEPADIDPLASQTMHAPNEDLVSGERLPEATPLRPDTELEIAEAEPEPAVIQRPPDPWTDEAGATIVADPGIPEAPPVAAKPLPREQPPLYEASIPVEPSPRPASATEAEPPPAELPEAMPLEGLREPAAAAVPTVASPVEEDVDGGKTRLLDPRAKAPLTPVDDPEPAGWTETPAAPPLQATDLPSAAEPPAGIVGAQPEVPEASTRLPEPDRAAVDPLPVPKISAAPVSGDDSDIFGDPLDDTASPAARLADEETAPDLVRDPASSPEGVRSPARPAPPARIPAHETPGSEPLVSASAPAMEEEPLERAPDLAVMPRPEDLPEVAAASVLESEAPLRAEAPFEPEHVLEEEAAFEDDPMPEAEPAVEPEAPFEPGYPLGRGATLEPEPTFEPEAPFRPGQIAEPETPFEAEAALEPEVPFEPEYPPEPQATLERDTTFEPEAPLGLEAPPQPQVPFEPDMEVEAKLPTEPELPPQAEASGQPALAASPPSVHPHDVRETLEKVAWEAFGPLSEQLVREVLKKVEEIAWEVVPQLAEQLVKEEIERLKRSTDD